MNPNKLAEQARDFAPFLEDEYVFWDALSPDAASAHITITHSQLMGHDREEWIKRCREVETQFMLTMVRLLKHYGETDNRSGVAQVIGEKFIAIMTNYAEKFTSEEGKSLKEVNELNEYFGDVQKQLDSLTIRP